MTPPTPDEAARIAAAKSVAAKIWWKWDRLMLAFLSGVEWQAKHDADEITRLKAIVERADRVAEAVRAQDFVSPVIRALAEALEKYKAASYMVPEERRG